MIKSDIEIEIEIEIEKEIEIEIEIEILCTNDIYAYFTSYILKFMTDFLVFELFFYPAIRQPTWMLEV